MKMPDSIKSIAIVGGGISGWVSATMLSAMLRSSSIKIMLIDFESDSQVSDYDGDVAASNSFINQCNLLNAIGISIDEFIEACDANFFFGDRFIDGGDEKIDFIQAFSGCGLLFDRVSFSDLIARFNMEVMACNADEFSLGAYIARMNKVFDFSSSSIGKSELSSVGVSFNRKKFIDLFKSNKNNIDIEYIQATAVTVNRTEDRIDYIRVGDKLIESDLYFDCTGLQRLLIGALTPVNHLFRLHYSHIGNVDNRHVAQSSTRNYFYENGCVKKYLNCGSQGKNIYLKNHESCDEYGAVDFFCSSKSWVNNCLSIGSASAYIGDFSINEIDFVQQQIQLFYKMMPRIPISSSITNLYNKITLQQVDSYWAFNYLIIHSDVLFKKENGCDFGAVDGMPLNLLERIISYRDSGQYFPTDYEVLTESYWLNYFIGWGFLPKSFSADCRYFDLSCLCKILLKEKLNISLDIKSLNGLLVNN